MMRRATPKEAAETPFDEMWFDLPCIARWLGMTADELLEEGRSGRLRGHKSPGSPIIMIRGDDLRDWMVATGRDPVDDFETVRAELDLFDPAFAAKPQVVAANKIDAMDDEQRLKRLEKRAKKLKLPFFRISGVTGEGVPALLESAWTHLAAARDREAADVEVELHSR